MSSMGGVPAQPAISKTKLWRCGDRSRCAAVPSADVNAWDTCLKPLMQEDHEQCEAWKDEIQNLLIFSGLFSAVVTAFVVQTYGDLQPDPQYYTTALLAQLVQLQNKSMSNTSANYSPAYLAVPTPSASSIRTNMCWFSSLVLSLIVVLVGTVALQWLREFRRYPPSSSPKKLFATRNLRAESFKRWCAPQIIAGLPQILQLAVVLFFIGLMDLLLQLNQAVAAPVILLAGLAMAFQTITTVLPTLQSFWLINKSGFSEPPLHCPYKSPQSWAFLRLVTSTPFRFLINWIGFLSVQILMVPMAPIVMLAQILNIDTYFWKFVDRLAVTLHLKYLGTINNWDEFDDLWLEERYRSAVNIPRASHNHFHKGTGSTDYDAARGIAHIMNSRVVGERMAMALYHCFQRLDAVVITDDLYRLMTRGLPSWLFALEGPRKGCHLIPSTPSMIKDENEMFLLSRLPQTIHTTKPLHIFRLRQIELFVRITAHMFATSAWEECSLQRDSLSVRPRTRIGADPGPLFVPSLLRDDKAMKLLPHSFAIDVVEQLVIVFEAYVSSVLAGEDEGLGDTPSVVEAEPVLGGFMDVMHSVSLFLAFIATPTNKEIILITDLAFTLDKITARLTHALPRSLKNPRVFLCGKLYASRFDFADWIPLQRRAPLLACSFQSLVHILSWYGSEVCDHRFSYLKRRYTAQWRRLCEEVLRKMSTPGDVLRPTLHPDFPQKHSLDVNDVAEFIYPSIDHASNMLCSPSSSSETPSGVDVSLHSDFGEVSLPRAPAPALTTSTCDQRHLILPRRSHCALANHSFDTYTSSTPHKSARTFDLTPQMRHKAMQYERNSFEWHDANTYEMV